MAISKYDQFRRAYSSSEAFYKIVLSGEETSGVLRNNTLKQEAELLREIKGLSGIPKYLDYIELPNSSVLVLERIRGRSLPDGERATFRLVGALSKSLPIVFALTRHGISHNDLFPQNIMVGPKGRITLVDFDQASLHHPIVAFVRMFCCIPVGSAKVYCSFPGLIVRILRDFALRILPPEADRLLKRLRKMHGKEALPTLRKDASHEERLLWKAWRLAQLSGASSPKTEVAYYSLWFGGHHFPGERPWVERWRVLSEITEYSGKRVLELGCNMGLLSSSLLKEKGASAALGIDMDADILEAARLISKAYKVTPQFDQINFDSDESWEQRLLDYRPDVVFALNVLNWIGDKQRFLSFLGSFDELVFEGHNDYRIETSRLKVVGFRYFKKLTVTERGRDLIYCSK